MKAILFCASGFSTLPPDSWPIIDLTSQLAILAPPWGSIFSSSADAWIVRKSIESIGRSDKPEHVIQHDSGEIECLTYAPKRLWVAYLKGPASGSSAAATFANCWPRGFAVHAVPKGREHTGAELEAEIKKYKLRRIPLAIAGAPE